MMWGAFLARERSEVAILLENQNSESYTRTLEGYLLPHANRMHCGGWVFHQNNPSIHILGHTQRWFSDRSMTIFYWAAKSSDFNPTENFWENLSQRVFVDMRQFQSIEDLKSARLRSGATWSCNISSTSRKAFRGSALRDLCMRERPQIIKDANAVLNFLIQP